MALKLLILLSIAICVVIANPGKQEDGKSGVEFFCYFLNPKSCLIQRSRVLKTKIGDGLEFLERFRQLMPISAGMSMDLKSP